MYHRRVTNYTLRLGEPDNLGKPVTPRYILKRGMERGHITDTDLERYHLGMVIGAELDYLKDHIIGCASCAARAQGVADYVDAMRSAAIRGEFRFAYTLARAKRRLHAPAWNRGD